MKPTPQMLADALKAAYALKDSGRKPTSFTKDPEAYVLVIATTILRDIPEPRRRKGIQNA